jgi:hypothetical protein
MDPELQKDIASQGGVASHEAGTGHEWTRKEAKLAGSKGGLERARRIRERKYRERAIVPDKEGT